MDLNLIEASKLYRYLDKEIGGIERKLDDSKLSHDDWKKWQDKFAGELRKNFLGPLRTRVIRLTMFHYGTKLLQP